MQFKSFILSGFYWFSGIEDNRYFRIVERSLFTLSEKLMAIYQKGIF
jgi:hypothetical protein